MSKRVELGLSVLVVIGGVAWIIGAQNIRHSLKTDQIGEQGFPLILGAIFVIGGSVLVWRNYQAWRADARPQTPQINEPGDEEPDLPASNTRPLVMWGVCMAWTVAVGPIGFLIVTPILIAAELWLMDFRRPIPVLVIALLGSFLMWFTFDFLLMINIPGGLLAPITDPLHL